MMDHFSSFKPLASIGATFNPEPIG